MEVDESGNITKLLGIGLKYVYFYASIGYNNGVYLLNDICKSRYGNSSLGATARSLNIEDLESRMNATGIAARNANKGKENRNIQYGTTKKYTLYAQYPAIYVQEKYSGVDVSDVADGTQVITGSVDATAQARMNPNGKSGSDDIYTTLPEKSEITGPLKANLTCTQTYYYMSSPSSYFDDSNFYNMIFRTRTDFWLASRCVSCISNSSYAVFGLRCVSSSRWGDRSFGLNANTLFRSDGYNTSSSSRLAPVVFLGSGIQVKSGSGTESDPYVIGK